MCKVLAVSRHATTPRTQDYTAVAGGNFDPKQRRNPGAPETAALEAQMGAMKYSLYEPTKKNY